jgi:hypothetical protein
MLRYLALAAALTLACAPCAYAGAPLKGIDVKLGKNPGGGAAARLTDASGTADFGVVPKGDYTLSVSPGAVTTVMHVVVQGAATGPIERDISALAAARGAPISFAAGGTQPLRVTVTSAAPTPNHADTPAAAN